MFCKNCGRQIPDNSRLCCYCGVDIPKELPVVNPVPYVPKKPKRLFWLWMTLVVVAVLGTALAMWMLLGGNGEKTSKQKDEPNNKQKVEQQEKEPEQEPEKETEHDKKKKMIPVWCLTEYEDGDSGGYTIVMNADGTIQSKYNDYYKTTYRYDEDENLVEETYTRIGEYTNITTYTYNDAGQLVERETNNDGTSTGRICYTYDAKGNLIQQEAYSDGEVSWSIGYTYNEVGAVEKSYEVRFYEDSTYARMTRYQYDDRGNMVEEKIYEQDDTGDSMFLTRYESYVYDEDNRLTEMASYRDETELRREYYLYDAKGNCAKKLYYYDGCLENTVTYLYDSDGNLIEEKYEDQTGGNYNYTYTYDYDEHGNLIQKVCSEAGERFLYNYGWECFEMSEKQAKRLYEEYGHGEMFNFPDDFVKEMEGK